MKYILSFILTFIIHSIASDFTTNTSTKYLSQTFPGDTAQIFAPGFVSLDGRYEYACSFSPDGTVFLFSTSYPNGPSDLMITELKNGKWSIPHKANFTEGNNPGEMEAFFSPDGNSIFFTAYEENGCSIMQIKINENGYSKAQKLATEINTGIVFYPVSVSNGNLYYTDVKKRKIMVSTPENGQYLNASEVGIPFGGHSFVTANDSTMLLDSKGDIYISFKQLKDNWSEPQKNVEISTEDFKETCPSLSPDGKFLFFSRYNEPGNLSNIYWVSSSILKPYKINLNRINKEKLDKDHVIRYGKNVEIDGILNPDEWNDSELYNIDFGELGDAEIHIKHDDKNINFNYHFNLTDKTILSFPEIYIDSKNNGGNHWQEDDWWFHISGTDCDAQGKPDQYENCRTVQSDWKAEPNFELGKQTEPLFDFEVQIPFNKAGLVKGKPFSMALAAALYLQENNGRDNEFIILYPAHSKKEVPESWMEWEFK